MAMAKWTWLVYIAAHNDLLAYGNDSATAIWNAGSSGDVKVSVLLDTTLECRRYASTGPADGEIKRIADFDSGSPSKLLQMVKWAFEANPAERYGLVLWSHGTGSMQDPRDADRSRSESGGWDKAELEAIAREARGDSSVRVEEVRERAAATSSVPAIFRSTLQTIFKADSPAERAICFDDGSRHSLDTIELGNVAKSVSELIGQKLDVLGMDACLMASLEVAHQIRDSVGCMVASSELVPGRSWPYPAILAKLKADPDMSAADAAKLIVGEYLAFYTANPPAFGGGDITKVALDLSKVGAVSDVAGALADALTADIANQRARMWSAQRATRKAETVNNKRKRSKFDYHLWDLGSFARALAEGNPNPAVAGAANALLGALAPGGAVINEAHVGDWFNGTSGVTAYVAPPGLTRITPYYPRIAFATDARWDKLLTAYHQP